MSDKRYIGQPQNDKSRMEPRSVNVSTMSPKINDQRKLRPHEATKPTLGVRPTGGNAKAATPPKDNKAYIGAREVKVKKLTESQLCELWGWRKPQDKVMYRISKNGIDLIHTDPTGDKILDSRHYNSDEIPNHGIFNGQKSYEELKKNYKPDLRNYWQELMSMWKRKSIELSQELDKAYQNRKFHKFHSGSMEKIARLYAQQYAMERGLNSRNVSPMSHWGSPPVPGDNEINSWSPNQPTPSQPRSPESWRFPQTGAGTDSGEKEVESWRYPNTGADSDFGDVPDVGNPSPKDVARPQDFTFGAKPDIPMQSARRAWLARQREFEKHRRAALATSTKPRVRVPAGSRKVKEGYPDTNFERMEPFHQAKIGNRKEVYPKNPEKPEANKEYAQAREINVEKIHENADLMTDKLIRSTLTRVGLSDVCEAALTGTSHLNDPKAIERKTRQSTFKNMNYRTKHINKGGGKMDRKRWL